MHTNVIFWLKFVRAHNTISHAEVAHSTELSHHVKQCVLATLKRDKLVFWLHVFFISGLHIFLFRLHISVGLHA